VATHYHCQLLILGNTARQPRDWPLFEGIAELLLGISGVTYHGPTLWYAMYQAVHYDMLENLSFPIPFVTAAYCTHISSAATAPEARPLQRVGQRIGEKRARDKSWSVDERQTPILARGRKPRLEPSMSTLTVTWERPWDTTL
jgi:hypothetical protein